MSSSSLSPGAQSLYLAFSPGLHLFVRQNYIFTSIGVTNTSEETSCYFNFTYFKILIFFLRKTVVSHLVHCLVAEFS